MYGSGGYWAAGRAAGRLGGWRYRAPEIDGELHDGDLLPIWGGLRVWHLPGHTPGHCALVAERSEARGLVFAGDLFASHAWSVHRPPGFLNRDSRAAEASLLALAAARPAGVLPGHYDRMEPALHARRLAKLAGL